MFIKINVPKQYMRKSVDGIQRVQERDRGTGVEYNDNLDGK